MKRKILIIMTLALCLCLSACALQGTSDTLFSSSSTNKVPAGESSNQPISDGKETEVIPEDQSSSVLQEPILNFENTEVLALTESAELLTKVLTESTIGFSTDLDPASNHLRYPSEEDPNSINQFLYLLTAYQSNGYEHSLYADSIYKDNDGVYHLSAKEASTILHDVLGISSWDSSTSNFEYDSAMQEYLSGLEFGIGCGGWKCGEIQNSQIDLKQNKLIVEYKAESLFPDASGKGNDVSYWLCRNTFFIGKKEDGQPYLSFIKSEILY